MCFKKLLQISSSIKILELHLQPTFKNSVTFYIGFFFSKVLYLLLLVFSNRSVQLLNFELSPCQ